MFSRIKTLKEAFNHFQLLIQKTYDTDESRSITQIVFKELLGYDTIQLILNENELLPASLFEQLDFIAFQLNENKPIQYILGHTEFYDLPFEVNENVLIPRPETEELVDWIIKENDLKNSSKKILDIGTGSGCIPIALKFNSSNSEVYSIDVSEKSLALASKNANKNRVDVEFRLQDVLKLQSIDSDFDIVVSNPPYVLESEKSQMRKNVLDYEPSIALFVKDEDPLIFYIKIIELVQISSKKPLKLYFEYNEQYTNALVEKFNHHWRNIEIRKDLRGKDRMLRAELIR